MELLMAENRMKENERPDESQPGRRIVEVEYEEITRVIEFKIFVVRPDGKKARVLGGGAFEEQDLDRVAQELVNLANEFAYDEPLEEIAEGEELDEPLEEIEEGEELDEPLEEIEEGESSTNPSKKLQREKSSTNPSKKSKREKSSTNPSKKF